jgi:rhodanese-related sulfurtransferase
MASVTLVVAGSRTLAYAHTDVTAEQVHQLIESTDSLIILDVREPYEYCGVSGHIPGALNYPWNSGVLEERYEELINNEILVVCQSGGRSHQAANFLDSKGYTLVYDMLGGMNVWMWETELCVDADSKYSGGTGEPNDPYQIATAEDLIALGETPEDYDKHFILTADIDLDPNLPGGKVFDKAVISPDIDPNTWNFEGTPFTGVFNGKGHTISHLTISGENYLGMFGRLESKSSIINLGVMDININGSGYYIGGLVGSNFGDVMNCYSTGEVNGDEEVGGLVGGVGYYYGMVLNSYSSCSVQGNADVGGLVGFNLGTVVMSYSNSLVIGSLDIGGLVGCDVLCGRAACDFGSTSLSFWDTETSEQTMSAGGEGKTTAEMMNPNTFISAGWDFVGETVNGPNDIWWILDGRDYPRLWWQLPTDDFEDGQAGPLWFVYAIEPELVWLEETNGRLEVNTAGANEDVDAIYAGDGWGLNATKEFALRVDFHFSKVGVGDGRINIGLVPSLDPSAMKWAEFEVGAFDERPFFLYEIRDESWVREEVNDRSSDNGTLYVSYDPDKDELYFSDRDYGKDKAIWTVTGLVHGRWQSDSVYVILSGGSEGMALTGEDAWLDNFAIDSGGIIQ